MGDARFGLRLDDETKKRWEAGARERGYRLAEFVRACVESELDGGRPEVPRARRGSTVATSVSHAHGQRGTGGNRKRTGLCAHRRGPDEYCPRCDE